MTKGALTAVAAVLLALGLAGGAGSAGQAVLPAKIIYVNVGQGDAVVMRVGGKIIVSDTGEFRYDVLEEALRDGLKAKRIDVLILGHAHDDHSRNAARLLREWEVREVVMNQSLWWIGTPRNRAVMDAINDEPGIRRTHPTAGDRFEWGGARWTFVNPPSGEFLGGTSKIAGNSSLVFLLEINGVRALFTGDIERKVARRVATALGGSIEEPLDIFLATHHGSKEGSIDELLSVIRPRWAVVSSGQNSHEHPSLEALARLRTIGASIWCTHTNGSVTARISVNGKLTWKASLQVAPWWSAKSKRQTGICVNR